MVLACLQPLAVIHASLLFCFSHIRMCPFIYASYIPTVGFRTTLPTLPVHISLLLNPLYPGVQSNSTVNSSVLLFRVLWQSRTSFELSVKPNNAVKAALLSVHMWTFLRLPTCIVSWAAAYMPVISACIMVVYLPSRITMSLSPLRLYTLAPASSPFFESICVQDVPIAVLFCFPSLLYWKDWPYTSCQRGWSKKSCPRTSLNFVSPTNILLLVVCFDGLHSHAVL